MNTKTELMNKTSGDSQVRIVRQLGRSKSDFMGMILFLNDINPKYFFSLNKRRRKKLWKGMARSLFI